jgi:hypothetical protein
MTSQINYSAVIETYPVAGQDNDSQGFRDNFTSIKTGLEVAANEITNLENSSVLTSVLGSSPPVPVVNDLIGSTIQNGLYSQFNGVFYNAGVVSGIVNVNVNNGPIQKFTLSANTVLTFTNWPPTGAYGVIRVMIATDHSNTYTANFSTANSGTMKPATGFTFPISVSSTGKYEVIEAWTVDHGTNVFIKSVGEY